MKTLALTFASLTFATGMANAAQHEPRSISDFGAINMKCQNMVTYETARFFSYAGYGYFTTSKWGVYEIDRNFTHTTAMSYQNNEFGPRPYDFLTSMSWESAVGGGKYGLVQLTRSSDGNYYGSVNGEQDWKCIPSKQLAVPSE